MNNYQEKNLFTCRLYGQAFEIQEYINDNSKKTTNPNVAYQIPTIRANNL
jgi:hypothetical protein